jgi:N-acetylmuramoyl-L-alanine amidase
VLKPGESLMCLLLVLAGCSTGGRQAQNPVPRDWRSSSPAGSGSPATEEVTEAPRAAPPPATGPAPPGQPNTAPAGSWIPLDTWSRENGLGPLRQISSAPAPAFALNTTNGLLVVHMNSQVATWQGVEFHLGFEPRLVNGTPFVHVLDLKKNMLPLIQGAEPLIGTNRTIVIDPGHGGQNTGTISITEGVYEKDYTLDWARRLEHLLAANGWQVYLTRTNDLDVSLSNRVAIAEEHQANLFISLHFNSAAPNEDQAGLETFCLTPSGMPSTLTRGYEDDASQVFTNNAFDVQNLQYAFLLHRNLLAVTGADRGLRHARFLGVLRGQNRPAVLIEGGYLSNPREAERIADPAYRQELAEAVAQALTGPREVKRPPTGTTCPTPENHPSAGAAQPVMSDLHSSNSPAGNQLLH